MKILICPDKFKGSLSAREVCAFLEYGIKSVNSDLEVISHPIADGGEGSVEILKELLKLNECKVKTVDPIGRPIEAHYYYTDQVAYIELASASGLVLLEESERTPMNSSTMGTGYLIKDAMSRGCTHIYLFIGGSATNDGGIGIASALGFQFFDENDMILEAIGANLGHIKKINSINSDSLSELQITVLCDVSNPMYGPNGAAYVYAGQKGANQVMIEELDRGLKNYGAVLQKLTGRSIAEMPGMGAAGGVGASLVGLMGAEITNGFAMLSSKTQLEKYIIEADLVITGEGKIDHTSFQGKVVGNILSMCRKHNTPYGLIGGIIEIDDNSTQFKHSIIERAKSIQVAMRSAEQYLISIGQDIGTFL